MASPAYMEAGVDEEVLLQEGLQEVGEPPVRRGPCTRRVGLTLALVGVAAVAAVVVRGSGGVRAAATRVAEKVGLYDDDAYDNPHVDRWECSACRPATCDCAWASQTDACSTATNDGTCCFHCCCYASDEGDEGYDYDYDQHEGGNDYDYDQHEGGNHYDYDQHEGGHHYDYDQHEQGYDFYHNAIPQPSFQVVETQPEFAQPITVVEAPAAIATAVVPAAVEDYHVIDQPVQYLEDHGDHYHVVDQPYEPVQYVEDHGDHYHVVDQPYEPVQYVEAPTVVAPAGNGEMYYVQR